MSNKLYCSNCGAELPADAVFCHKCGVRILVPNQPMTTRSKMTASENAEPSLNMNFQQFDEDDISLTTILKDLEAITADPSSPTTLSYTHDNAFGTTTTYQESGPSQYSDPVTAQNQFNTSQFDTNRYYTAQDAYPNQNSYDQTGNYQEPSIPVPPQNAQPSGQQNLLRDYFPDESNSIPVTNDDDPWPWELPAFTNTDQNAFSPIGNSSTPPQMSGPIAQQMTPEAPQPPLAPVNDYSSYDPQSYTQDNYHTDGYSQNNWQQETYREDNADTNRVPEEQPAETEKNKVAPKKRNVKKATPVSGKTSLFNTLSHSSKNKYFTYDEDEDEDFEDEYAEPRRWPFVLLAILLIIVIITAALYFFMPSVLNKGIDTFNSIANTHIKHLNTADSDTSDETIITVTAAPQTTPEATATPEPTVEPTPEPEVVSEDAYLDEVTSHFIRFYNNYLTAMNNDNVASLTNASESLLAELQERYESQNKDYNFQNNEMYLDAPTYLVYSTTTEGEYDVAFTVQAYNYTTRRDTGEEITSNPIMEVVMRYNPDTDEWTITQMDINNSLELDQNNLLQIIE